MPRSPAGMKHLPGGTFRMGSDRHYSEEQPERRVEVGAFWIDTHPVTNAEFARFVAATGFVSFAEVPPDPADYPGMDPELAVAGSLLFTPTAGPVDLANPFAWWTFAIGACWHRPRGADSTVDGLADHPVVHVTHGDAAAYALWAGKSLPSEAEWEYAARGGLDGMDYVWGATFEPNGMAQANYWRGNFPWRREGTGLSPLTSPVGEYPANGFGLFDMIGNAWEWTEDWWSQGAAQSPKSPCCVPSNPRGGDEQGSIDPASPDSPIPRKVLKGGSHLCAESYCQRYRPAARYPQPIDTTTSHVGFRCVIRINEDAAR